MVDTGQTLNHSHLYNIIRCASLGLVPTLWGACFLYILFTGKKTTFFLSLRRFRRVDWCEYMYVYIEANDVIALQPVIHRW